MGVAGDLLTLVFFFVDFDATVSLVRMDRYEYYHLGRSHHLTPYKLKQEILTYYWESDFLLLIT